MIKFVVLCLLPLVIKAWYKPHIGVTFQWQLDVDDDNRFDYSMHADMYDVDLWAVTPHDIHNIHAKHAKVICYFSAGSYDKNRPDYKLFHRSDIGLKMHGWNENWTDIRSHNVRSIMAKRMDLAQSKGCDGIEPDNVDGHEDDNHTGFSFGFNDQLDYNKWLADQAHSRDLSIGLKNDAEQIPQLHSRFDWAINEECHENGNECMDYHRFLDENKPVFNIEYVDNKHVSSHDRSKCTSHHPNGMSTQFKLTDAVTAWSYHCPGQ